MKIFLIADKHNIEITRPSEDVAQLEEISEHFDSTYRARTAISSDDTLYSQITSPNVDKALYMDFSRLIGKPFHVYSLNWTTSQAQGAEFAGPGGANGISLPSICLSNNISRAPFLLASLYNMRACFNVQVAGTPMHGGALVAYAVPSCCFTQGNVSKFGSLLHAAQSAPHAMLFANSATTACIDVPWYANTKLVHTPRIDLAGISPKGAVQRYNFSEEGTADYAHLRFRVLSPLTAPASGATTLVITISVTFTEMNFYAPKATYPASTFLDELQVQGLPTLSTSITKVFDGATSLAKNFSADILDSGRAWLRSMTGLHNPNIRNPDNRMIVNVRNNPNYVDKPVYYQHLDPFADHQQPLEEYVSGELDEGLISNIVRKPMAVSTFELTTSMGAGTVLFSAPISPLMFRQRSDQRELIITAPIDKLARMSKFWRGTLRLSIQHNGSSFHMFKLLVVREYYYYDHMENQTPALADVLNNPTDTLEFSAGGQVQHVDLPQNSVLEYIPLIPDPVAVAATHGRVSIYLLQPMVTNGTVSTSCQVTVHLSALPDFSFYGYGDDLLRLPVITPAAEDEGDELQVQSVQVPVNISQDTIVSGATKLEGKPVPTMHFRPIIHIRDHLRRMTPCTPFKFTSTEITGSEGVVIIPVASMLFGIRESYKGLHSVISSMFAGYRGGVKVKLMVRGTTQAQATFVPPMMRHVRDSHPSAYQTVPNPPYASGYDVFRDSYSLIRDSMGKQGPFLETNDYFVSAPSTIRVRSTADPREANLLADACMIEFTIPYMSLLRFVNMYSYNYEAAPANYADLYANSLGHIVLATSPQISPNIEASPLVTINDINVYPFIACDDVGRMFFQTLSVPLTLQSTFDPLSGNNEVDTNYNSGTEQIPAYPMTLAPTYFVGSAAI